MHSYRKGVIDMNRVSLWTVADQHFFHDSMLRFRQENGLLNQNLDHEGYLQLVKKNHNSVVKPQDIVLMLGDLLYKMPDQSSFPKMDAYLKKWVRVLEMELTKAGRKVWILGNHDREFVEAIKKDTLPSSHYEQIKKIKTLLNEVFENIEKDPIIMDTKIFSHEPITKYLGMRTNYHGHLHTGLTAQLTANSSSHENVNLEFHEFMPVDLGPVGKLLN